MADSPQKAFSFPILIVDDNLLLRTILETSLKAAGYEVVVAENGREALEIFRNGRYPIVMTDWVMPEMDGLELCRAIRDSDVDRYTYIILLTSNDSKNDIIAGLEAGADEYLIKPPHQNELLTRLKTAKRFLDLESSLRKSKEEIRILSMFDPQTGIFNRRYMDERIPQEIKRACRYGRSLSLLIVGINHFEELTDSHGQAAADKIVKECSDCLAESVRKEVDWLARYAEGKFVVVLPETDASGAMILAKRLRIRIAALAISGKGGEIRLAASFGVAGFTPGKQQEAISAQVLLEKADRCLQQARSEGGDTIKGVQLSC